MHAMQVQIRGQRYFVYCFCGWHDNQPHHSIHEAAESWYAHDEVHWKADE